MGHPTGSYTRVRPERGTTRGGKTKFEEGLNEVKLKKESALVL